MGKRADSEYKNLYKSIRDKVDFKINLRSKLSVADKTRITKAANGVRRVLNDREQGEGFIFVPMRRLPKENNERYRKRINKIRRQTATPEAQGLRGLFVRVPDPETYTVKYDKKQKGFRFVEKVGRRKPKKELFVPLNRKRVFVQGDDDYISAEKYMRELFERNIKNGPYREVSPLYAGRRIHGRQTDVDNLVADVLEDLAKEHYKLDKILGGFIFQ